MGLELTRSLVTKLYIVHAPNHHHNPFGTDHTTTITHLELTRSRVIILLTFCATIHQHDHGRFGTQNVTQHSPHVPFLSSYAKEQQYFSISLFLR